MLRGAAQDLAQVLLEDVDAARHERGPGAERQRQRVERVVHRAGRRRLRLLPHLAGRRVLPLGQAVDPVVEHQDLHPDVAAQRVDQVVAADRHGVAVAGRDPDLELRPRHLEPGRHRRGAAVDRVEAEGVHVVRETAGAADPRHHHELLARDPELGEDLLHGREDRVVPAARAPAHLLVALEVLLGELQGLGRRRRLSGHGRSAPGSRWILSKISWRVNGRPCTLVKEITSLR